MSITMNVTKGIYELPTIEDGAVLVEVTIRGRDDDMTCKTRAIWDDTRAAAWEDEEFGWVPLLPDEFVDVSPATVGTVGRYRGRDLGEVMASRERQA